MRKKTPESRYAHLEDRIAALYRSGSPSAVFADRLERKLSARAMDLSRTTRQRVPVAGWLALLRRPAWAIPLVVVLTLALAVATIGPERVLAAVQQFLGYVPGIGFVDLDQARTLPAPVAVTREGVTLHVDSVFAQPRGTILLISSQGLPPEGEFTPGFDADWEFAATLRLSDGQRLPQRASEYSYGWGKLEFGPIPAAVDQITLEMDRLPLVPPGAAPENWEVPLTLIPLLGELPVDRYPQPYAPPGASETVNGVTLSVVGVAQSAQETGVQVQATWEDTAWRWSSSMDLVLHDDIGHVYLETGSSQGSVAAVVVEPLEGGEQPAPKRTTALESRIFAPISLTAQRLTLVIDRIYFDMPAEAKFTFDPGANPQPGQTWSLDERLQVAGFPVHIIGAQLREDASWQGENGPFYALDFILEVTPQADRSVYNFFLDSPGARGMGFRGGAGSRHVATVTFQRSLPKVVEISFQEAGIALHGPWSISWDVTTPESARYSIRELHPAEAADEINGLALDVEEVLITDKLTMVKVTASGLPTGAALDNLAGRGETGRPIWPTLEDQRGVKLDEFPAVSWRNSWKSDTQQQLTFASPSPLARSLTLTIPAIELLLPGTANLTVNVPENLAFHEETYETVMVGPDGTEHQVAGARRVSAWEVDLPVEIAGYRLHFTRAQVELDQDLSAGRFWLTLYGNVPPGGPGGQQLVELRFARIARPDGEMQPIDYTDQPWEIFRMPRGGIGQVDPASAKPQAYLHINVSDPTGLALLPGEYTLELDGAVVSVPGPWRLSWNLASASTEAGNPDPQSLSPHDLPGRPISRTLLASTSQHERRSARFPSRLSGWR